MLKYVILTLLFFLEFQSSFPAAQCGRVEYGDRKALVKIIEYASPTCTVCSEFSKTIFPKLYKDYILEKKVHLTVINLPYNAIDLKACILVQQSPNPQEFNTFVYQMQKDWLFSKNPIRTLTHLLEKKGMSPIVIKKALRNTREENKIIQQRLIAEHKHNIEAIPLVIIGQKTILGLMPWDRLKEVIEQALMHIKKGNKLESFGESDDKNKKLTRKT